MNNSFFICVFVLFFTITMAQPNTLLVIDDEMWAKEFEQILEIVTNQMRLSRTKRDADCFVIYKDCYYVLGQKYYEETKDLTNLCDVNILTHMNVVLGGLNVDESQVSARQTPKGAYIYRRFNALGIRCHFDTSVRGLRIYWDSIFPENKGFVNQEDRHRGQQYVPVKKVVPEIVNGEEVYVLLDPRIEHRRKEHMRTNDLETIYRRIQEDQ